MSVQNTESNAAVQTIVSIFHHLIANPAMGTFNLDLVARLSASISSAEYMNNKMAGVQKFGSAGELIDFACANSLAEGLVLEFGVFSGTSINRIAQNRRGPVYGFDSFEGLPEAWRNGFGKGHFARTDLPAVEENVELIVGWFDRTLPTFLDEHPGPAALIHVDCDLYSSTQTVFSQLRERIVPGTIILFDEYFNYPGWELHEYKALQEFATTTGLQYQYIGLNTNHQQVAIRVIGMFNR